ncbi:MAG TPA: polyprenyl synthetase family protein [Micromonosporaceae bacterium]
MTAVDQANVRARVEKALAAFLAEQHTLLTNIDPALDQVGRAIESFVMGGGKRLRPAFAYWGYRGAGGTDSDQVVAAVAALELVQASALIHDDVMDASDTRRGEPAIHRRFAVMHEVESWRGDPEQFGAGAAILLGDLCLAWSDELLRCSGIELDALIRARSEFDLMRTEVIAGQYLDVHAQVTGDNSLHRASTVARYKAAKYTVERPLLVGAAIAHAPPRLQAAYSAFGLPLGEAFQLRDDILGVFGDPVRTGKPAGDDLREGKRTYLVAAAFENASPGVAAELDAGLGNPRLEAAGVARLREIMIETGALARTEERISMLTDTALAALSKVDLADDAGDVLTDLAQAATRRAG